MVPQVSGASQGLGQSSPSTCGRSALRPAQRARGLLEVQDKVLVVAGRAGGRGGGLLAEAKPRLQGARGAAMRVPTSNSMSAKCNRRGVYRVIAGCTGTSWHFMSQSMAASSATTATETERASRERDKQPLHLHFFIVFVCLTRFILAARFPRPCQQPRGETGREILCAYQCKVRCWLRAKVVAATRANQSPFSFCETPMLARACRNMQ